MPEYSGAGYRAHNLYKRLVERHPEINLLVLCGSETENLNAGYIYEGFTVKRISCKPFSKIGEGLLRKWHMMKNFKVEHCETKRFLEGLHEKPDLIHIFGENYVTASAMNYAIRNKIPLMIELVTEVSSPYQYVPFLMRFGVKTKPRRNFKFICISEKLRSICLRKGISDENIWCRPNPVDEGRFHPVSSITKYEIRDSLSRFSKNDILISYIAKFRPSKNHKFLLDVIRNLPDKFKLFLNGPLVESGPNAERDKGYYESLQKKIINDHLEERVEIQYGFCNDIEKYYQMSDVYAFPSEKEGLGTPILESIACGIPVVAHRIAGVTDMWIKEGINGFLSDLEPQRFAGKIEKAAMIGEETLCAESASIISQSGTKIIDDEYFKIACALAARNIGK